MTIDSVIPRLHDGVQDFLRQPMRVFIGGRFRTTPCDDAIEVVDPSTGQPIASVPACTAAEVDEAVGAARRALEGPWRDLRPADRERLILRLADALEEQGEEFAQIESLNQGKGIAISRAIEVGTSVDYLRYMAGWATKIEGSTFEVSAQAPPAGSRYMTYTLRQPVGVVGAIIPWNFPLSMLVWKVAPTLASGCTIVVKPSEETPLTALRFARLCQQVGIPDGVVNIVTGYGHVAGDALATWP